MALTEYDFSLFEPASSAAPARAPASPKRTPKREPIRQVRAPREESLASKQAKEYKVWKQSLVTYAIVGAVGLCMFMVVQTEAQRTQAMRDQQELLQEYDEAQERNISYRTQIERKYSLEIIQDVALNELHMVPVEGGRVTYLNIERGDQRLK